MKALENTKQIGAESRDFSNAWKMLNYANNKVKPTLLVLISQSRNNINAMYTSQQPSGGQATKFYSSCIVKLFSSESDNQAIKGKIKVGDKLIEEKTGRKISAFVDPYLFRLYSNEFEIEQFWGPFIDWERGYDFVVLTNQSNPLFFLPPYKSPQSCSICVISAQKFMQFVDNQKSKIN